MTDFGLFAEREPSRAATILSDLDRHATRRNAVIDALDFDALDTQTQREICMEDHHIDESLQFGPIYIHHLRTIEEQRAAIIASIPLAA